MSFASARPVPSGSLVPGPTVGYVHDIVELGDALFATPSSGAEDRPGGVFRSDDGGLNWWRASSGLPRGKKPGTETLPGSVTALAVVEGTLLAGLRDLEVYLSIDAGVSWRRAAQPPERPSAPGITDWRIDGFAVLPHGILADTTAGTFVSTDRGNTWTRKKLWMRAGGLEGRFEHVVAHAGVLYGTTGDSVMVSTDEGKKFTPHRLSHETSGIAARNGVVYVSFLDTSVPVVESRDRGQTWRATPTAERPAAYTSLALFGLKFPTRTTILGDRYQGDPKYAGVALDLEERGFVFGTPYGVWVSSDRGATVREAESGLTANAISQVGATDSRLFVSFKEARAGLLWSERARASWQNAPYGGSAISALVAAGAEISAGDDFGRVFQSHDEGRTFTETVLPATPHGPVQAIAVRGDRRLVVRGAILLSRDAGKTWIDATPGIPLEPEVLPESRASPETTSYPLTGAVVTERSVLLGAASGVLRGDPGRAWSVTKLPSAVVALGYDAGTVYAATATTLFASHDDGRSFSAIAGGFGTNASLAIASLGAARGELLIVAKHVGLPNEQDKFQVLYCRDGGKTWQLLSPKIEHEPTSPPAPGPGGWYVGLASDGVWFFPTAASPTP